ncbi:MAG: DUF2442 domain-containing protein [Candidatus Ozemobacteraceae bacterium]
MKSSVAGKNIDPEVEILNVGRQGVWLWCLDHEYFLPYSDYPWFEKASIHDVLDVLLLHGHHLHWPALDVDLEIDGLECSGKYPLIMKKPATDHSKTQLGLKRSS